jgi:hypothetical protein
MILDKEEHRGALLELINKSGFPGSAARAVVELQDALITATVLPSPPKSSVETNAAFVQGTAKN